MYATRLITLSTISFVVLGSMSPGQSNVLGMNGYNRLGSEFWASAGAGIAEKGIPGGAFQNPALISWPSPVVTLEAGWRPEAPLFQDSFDKLLLLPSYFSLGIPIRPLSLEFGYSIPYADRFDGGGSYVPYPEDPNNPVRYIPWNGKTVIQAVFASASYVLSENSSVGATAGLDFIHWNSNNTFILDGTGTSAQFIVGANTAVSRCASIGIAAHVSTKGHLHCTIRSAYTCQLLDSAGRAFFGDAWYGTISPPGATLGASLGVLPWLTLLGSIEYENWNTVGNLLIDRFQYHLGAVVSTGSDLAIRAGWFTLITPYSGYYYDNQYFLTGGIAWKPFEDLKLVVNYQTSKLLAITVHYIDGTSSDSFNQQALSGGVSFSW